MTDQCAGCGTAIDDADVRYEEHATDGSTEAYCSVNCVAGVDHVDEEHARSRIFADRLQA